MHRPMLRDQLADFRAYLANPRLIAPVPMRQGWAVMVGLYLAGLIVIGVFLAVWQRAFHLPAPEAFRGFAPALLAPIVIIAAPVAEEVLFRGWLTGRPRALWLLAMALLAGVLLVAVTLHWHDQAASLGVIAVALAALVGWLVLRKRSVAPRWYGQRFAVWFYLSVAVFGLMHLSNYPRLSWALVPMVAPQLWAGLMFGYLRMRHGLVASILAHGVGNAAALAVALGFGH